MLWLGTKRNCQFWHNTSLPRLTSNQSDFHWAGVFMSRSLPLSAGSITSFLLSFPSSRPLVSLPFPLSFNFYFWCFWPLTFLSRHVWFNLDTMIFHYLHGEFSILLHWPSFVILTSLNNNGNWVLYRLFLLDLSVNVPVSNRQLNRLLVGGLPCHFHVFLILLLFTL